MKAYLLKVICAAVLCAVTEAISGDGPGKATRKLICGCFLVLAILSPLDGADISGIDLEQLQREGEAVAAEGTAQAKKARLEIISDACAAYILNKAPELELTVSVELDDEGCPVGVALTGAASPLERQTLTDAIVRDLGIRKEKVRWMESHQSSE